MTIIKSQIVLTLCLITFLILLPTTVNSNIIYTATVTITPVSNNLVLWVDSYDASSDLWNKVGVSPYLNAQDQPTNYGWSSNDKEYWGNFGFQNTSQTGTIQSVTLYVYARCIITSGSDNELICFVDGSSYTFLLPNDWGWETMDVTATLNTWEKINNAEILLQQKAKEATIYVDASYLYIEIQN